MLIEAEAHAPPEAPQGPTGGGGGDRPWWRPGRAQLVGIVVALLFVAGVTGYALGRPDGPNPNDADVGFLDDMTTHHDQAISMAFSFLENSESDDWLLRHAARETVTIQSAEIRLMNELLADYDDEGDPDVAMDWMGTPVPQEAMPGLASRADVERLAQARGGDADELFSRLMIEHHRGGLHMAEAAADRARTDEVRELAERMAKVQRTEIDELQAQRQELGFEPVE